ncbi:hypothetical protein RYX36_033443 [Vicia faba]
MHNNPLSFLTTTQLVTSQPYSALPRVDWRLSVYLLQEPCIVLRYEAVQKHLKTFCHRERKKTRDHNVEHIDLASAKGIEDKHLKLLKTKVSVRRPHSLSV